MLGFTTSEAVRSVCRTRPRTSIPNRARSARSPRKPQGTGQSYSLMAHTYRGGSDGQPRGTRIDRTTNWAVVLTASLLTWTFSNESRPHYVLLIGLVMLTVFLSIEARRYRIYDVWRSRVRILERTCSRTRSTPGRRAVELAGLLSTDLRKPTIKTPAVEAVSSAPTGVHPALHRPHRGVDCPLTVFTPPERRRCHRVRRRDSGTDHSGWRRLFYIVVLVLSGRARDASAGRRRENCSRPTARGVEVSRSGRKIGRERPLLTAVVRFLVIGADAPSGRVPAGSASPSRPLVGVVDESGQLRLGAHSPPRAAAPPSRSYCSGHGHRSRSYASVRPGSTKALFGIRRYRCVLDRLTTADARSGFGAIRRCSPAFALPRLAAFAAFAAPWAARDLRRRRRGRSECPDRSSRGGREAASSADSAWTPAEDTPIDGSAVGVELLFVGLVIVSSA